MIIATEPTELNYCPDGIEPFSKALIEVRDRVTQARNTFYLLLPDAGWSTLVESARAAFPYVQYDCERMAFVWFDDF